MLAHLEANRDNLDFAFSPEGLVQMNENITLLNGGVPHKPIVKARFMETLGMKRPKGNSACKIAQYVEAQKGTNLFYAIYVDSNGKRIFNTIPLTESIALQEAGLSPVATQDENGNRLLFYLSPGDLVYVPTEEELESAVINHQIDPNRIYKAVSFNKSDSYFIKVDVATSIIDKLEFGALNKISRNDSNLLIKEHCIPIKVDRLGNIIMLNRKL